MSGFEIAGIVLGAFPILYDAAKDSRARYKDLKWWWRFETEFEDFISAIDREFIAFSQNQEILLSPLDIQSSERDILQNDPNTLLWHEPHIQKQLRKRLQNRYYTWYMEQLRDINEAISELISLLPTGKAYHLDSTSLESELFRLKRSFSHRKDELLAIIKERNAGLDAFLDRAAHISYNAESTKAGARVWSFLSAQRRARSIHECLQSHWRCSCPNGHSCGIGASRAALQDSGDAESRSMTLLFAGETEFTELQVEVEDKKPPSIMTQSSDQSVSSVSVLKHEVSVKNRLKQMKNKGSSIFALAASTLSIVGNPSGSGDTQKRLSRVEAKLKKGKLKDIISDPTPQPAVLPQRRVRFADSDPEPVEETKDPQKIDDMCSVAKGEVQRPFLGLLWDGHETRLLLRLDAPQVGVSKSLKVETLEDFLAATPRRNQRLKVGLDLILNVLNLGVSPWVPENWSKMELLLVRNPDSTEPTPYISHHSVRTALECTHRVERSAQARASLFTIGVLLLELLFRQTLENLPLRNEYLGKTGKADYTTDLCTAIQWQRQVEEEFGDRIADAIRRCVLCAFDPQPDLSDSSFVQAICSNVIKPLEEFLTAWSTR